jgi:hypothetical protein
MLAPSGEFPDQCLGVHIASHRDLVIVNIYGHGVDACSKKQSVTVKKEQEAECCSQAAREAL